MIRLARTSVAWTALLLINAGCGASYEKRLSDSVDQMKYAARLDKNLNPAPSKPAFDRFSVFVRPPKPMAQTEVFQLATLPPGQFDIAQTFTDSETGANPHVLARSNKPPKQSKNAPPPPPRGNFDSDVIGLLAAVFGDSESLHTKPKPETKKHNHFQHVAMATGTGNEVHLYIYKQGDFNVALIWVYPTAKRSALSSKVELCLGSFAYGLRAKDAFAGKTSRDDVGEGVRSNAAF